MLVLAGNLKIVKLVIANRVRVSDGDLQIAISYGFYDVTHYLLKKYPGFDQWGLLENVEELRLYKIYLKHGGGLDQPCYNRLVSFQDPMYTIVINHYQKDNKLIRMLPVDVWKLMMLFC